MSAYRSIIAAWLLGTPVLTLRAIHYYHTNRKG